MRKLVCLSLFSFASFGATLHPLSDTPQEQIAKINRALFVYDITEAESLFATTCAGTTQIALTASCEHEAGEIAAARDDDQQALAHYRKALAAWDADTKASPANRITTIINLGDTYRRLRRATEAQQTFADALKLLDPASPPVLRATALIRAGALCDEMNDTVRARQLLDQALAILRPLKESVQPQLAMALNETGLLELKSGTYKPAEMQLREGLALANAAFGEENPETASYMTNLALALLVQGQYSGADVLLRRARFVIESHAGKESLRLVPVLAELGSLEKREGKFRLAEENTEHALGILIHRIPYDTEQIVLTRVSLAGIYIRERKAVEAEALLPPAIEAERGFYNAGRTLADGLRELAELRVLQNQMPQAAALYREAIELYDDALGSSHPDIGPVLREYIDVMKRNKAPRAERREIEARVHAIESAPSS